MKLHLFLILGGIVGVVARYQLGLLITRATDSPFPWATLFINVLGSFALGFFANYLVHADASPAMRLMLTTGFCGGFTTLSTFSLELVNLFMSGEIAMASGYLGATVLVSPLACYAGFSIAAKL